MSIQTKYFPSSTPDKVGKEHSFGWIKEIAMYYDKSSKYICGMHINETLYGSDNGEINEGDIVTLESDEYVTGFTVSYSESNLIYGINLSYVSGLKLKTNKGRIIKGGHYTGDTDYKDAWNNEGRVFAFSFSFYKNCLTRVGLKWLDTYHASTSVSTADFIIDFVAPNTESTKSITKETETIFAFERMSQQVLNIESNTNISAELFVSVSTELKVGMQSTDVQTLNNSLRNQTKREETIVDKIADDEVAVLMAKGKVLKNDEDFWYIIEPEEAYVKNKVSDFEKYKDAYDVAPIPLSRQVDGLATIRKTKNGMVYYGDED